jgi:hypothetical protein
LSRYKSPSLKRIARSLKRENEGAPRGRKEEGTVVAAYKNYQKIKNGRK